MDLILVDDNPELIEQASVFLQKEDERFNIFTTTSPTEAYKYVQKKDFDVVISDYQMPEMNGIDLLKKLRNNDHQVPFIIFTGRGREEVAIKALNLGADRYIQKGHDVRTQYRLLANNIRQVIDLEESRQQIEEKKDKIKALHKISLKLREAKDIDEILDITIKAASEILEFNVCDIDFLKDGEFIPKRTTRHGGSPIESYPFKGKLAESIRDQKSIITDDIEKSNTAEPVDENYKSGISVPIGEYGVFQAISFQKSYFDEEDLELTELLISHVNSAIKSFRSESKRKDQNKKIEKLHEKTSQMENMRTMDEIFDLAVEAVENILDFNICSFSIVDGDDFVITAKSSGEYLPIGYRFPVDTGVAGRCYETRSRILTPDIKNDDTAQPSDNSYRSCITLPILDIGVFQIIFNEVEAFDENDVRLIELLINHVNEALKRAEEMDNLKESKRKLNEKKDKIEELHYAVHRIEKCKNKEEVYHLTTKIAENILDFDIAEFMIKKEDELIVTARSNTHNKGRDSMGLDEGIAGRTYKQNEPYLISDLQKHSNSEPTNDEYRSGISVPIGDFGVFQAISTVKDKFDQNDLDLAEILISHVKERLKNISNEISIEKKSEKIERLHKFAIKLESCRESDRVFELITDAGENILEFDICMTYVPQDDRLVLKTVSEDVEDDHFSLDDSIAGKSYTEEETFINDDIYRDDETDPIMDEYGSGISLPLGDYGVFQAVSKHKDAFTEEDVKLSKLLIDHAVEALNRIETEGREEFLLTLLRHDLKNKNNITKGYISLVKDTPLNEDQESFLEKASRSCEESTRLIKKVGMLSKIDKEKESQKVDLDRSLNRAIDDLRKIAEENDIEIDYEDSSYSVEAGTLLKEALNNIIENCIKHSEGTLINIHTEEKKDLIKLIIEDDGKGISDDKMKKIFRRGFKGKNSGGLGIGMYLVKKIIDNYDGEIRLKNSDLGGTKFDISLKRA